MISYDVLLQQLEHHARQAKQASTEQQMREQLTAVKALCDVMLSETPQKPTQSSVRQPLPKMLTAERPSMQQTAMPTMVTPPKLEEDDANGDSIFDF